MQTMKDTAAFIMPMRIPGSETEPPSGWLPCPPWLQREPIDVRSASEQELTQN